MSLLAGCILIYHYGMPWWWYAIAVAWYCLEWQTHLDYYNGLRRQIQELQGDVESLKPPIDHDYD